MSKENIIKVIKVAVGSSVAIAVAEYLGLAYASSAGIITLLTIQNTKKATLKLAITRTISYIIAIGILTILLSFFDNYLFIFGIYMALMVAINYKLGWPEVISVNATIGVHAVISEQCISLSFILNDAALVGIGLLIAIILNLKMHDKSKEIQNDIEYIEETLKELLHSIGLHLYRTEDLKIDREHISELIEYIDGVLDKAFENKDNTLKSHARYYIEYLMMRRNQCIVLIHFYRAVTSLSEIPAQADILAGFLINMAAEFNVRNNATNRMRQLQEIAAAIEKRRLPENKNEFEGAAVMYQLIKELEEFLRLKKEFMAGLTKEQLELYW